VVDRGGPAAGLLVAIAAVLILAIVAFAVIWAAPWDDDGDGIADPSVPGITDDIGGGGDVAPVDGDTGGGDGSGGEGGDGSGGTGQ
jgi:hypothetical protein